MKKLSTVLLIFVSAVSLLVVGCQKDVTAPLSTTSTDGMKLIQSVDPKPIQTFSELNADVKVEDGVLVFTSSKDFENTINFLQDTSLARSLKKQEIKRWEASLRSFISVYNYYEMAIQEGYSDLQNQDAFNSMKAKYQGKVRFLENEAIEPLIDNGNIFGRIISEKGQYKIGQSIVQYHKGKVISIPDGDLDKLALAMRNLNEDVSKGIYVHDLFLGQKKSQ